MHLGVAGSISGQGTYLSCRFDPRSGHVREVTYRCFSYSCFCLSLKSTNISLGEDYFFKKESDMDPENFEEIATFPLPSTLTGAFCRSATCLGSSMAKGGRMSCRF